MAVSLVNKLGHGGGSFLALICVFVILLEGIKSNIFAGYIRFYALSNIHVLAPFRAPKSLIQSEQPSG